VPVEFYDLATVRRIIDAQPSAERRALLSLLYGTGIEVGTALRLTRADCWTETQEINAAGTKTHTRHRVAVVSEWAWPAVRDYVRPFLDTYGAFLPSGADRAYWRPQVEAGRGRERAESGGR
jgi:integrase